MDNTCRPALKRRQSVRDWSVWSGGIGRSQPQRILAELRVLVDEGVTALANMSSDARGWVAGSEAAAALLPARPDHGRVSVGIPSHWSRRTRRSSIPVAAAFGG